MMFREFVLRTSLLLCVCGVASAASEGGAGFSLQAVEKPHAEKADRVWKRYRNNQLGYCVSYPSRWMRGDAFDGSGLVIETGPHRFSKPSGEIDIGPIALPTFEDARLKPASTRDDVFDQNLSEHLDGLKRFARAEKIEVLDQRRLTVAGSSALFVKSKYYDPLDRSYWLEELVFLDRKDQIYRMELQCPPDQLSRFEAVFVYMLNTLDLACSH